MKSNIFTADCMNPVNGLPSFPENFFDLAVVDPPYGLNATDMSMGSRKGHESTAKKTKNRLKGGGKLKNRLLNSSVIDWDNEQPSQSYFTELIRVSKAQIIWGGNYFDLPPCRCFIVWNKIQPWENFSQAEYAWTSFDKPSKVFSFSNRGGNNKTKKIHPTEKPIQLYDFVFKEFATEGMKVIDTHLGSGNSRISAAKAKMDFWGFETNKYYVENHLKNWQAYTEFARNPATKIEQVSIWGD